MVGLVFAMQGAGLVIGPLVASIFLGPGMSSNLTWRLLLGLGAIPGLAVWDDKVAADRFTGLGGLLFRGQGKIIAPGRVAVGDDVLRARRAIVINTGTAPSIPPIPGLAGTPYWTNHQAIETEQVPDSLIVLGGGAIGAELAQVFSRFGAQVTVVEALDRLLPPEEPEAGALLAEMFGREGIRVRTSAKAQRVTHDRGPGNGGPFPTDKSGI
jgi:pyruvate/2-oxoglutarate dehydrogenase complex dihydrolipoamide dehydrogenase (E3) component